MLRAYAQLPAQQQSKQNAWPALRCPAQFPPLSASHCTKQWACLLLKGWLMPAQFHKKGAITLHISYKGAAVLLLMFC